MGKENTDVIVKTNLWKARLPIMLTEFFLITFGVLLGLMLNEWRENSNKADFVERNIEAINAEMSRNYVLLKDAHAYHLELYPEILSVIAGRKDVEKIPFRGMRGAPVQSAAYEIALQGAIFTEIDAETSADIVQIYQSLDSLKHVYDMYAGVAPNIVFLEEAANEKIPEFMRMAFMDFLYSEEEALNEIALKLGKDPVQPWIETVNMFQGEPTDKE